MSEYRVLARKYRPQTFADLIGQEVLVRTLSNAIISGRIAHAFLLTGIRGIGKTTTARIIARALNCIGEDGEGGPTTDPCGVCPNCVQIREDRHPDVLEMDAASRTGVGDIRELIETVRYKPTQARYKIYIIDEVHMLSTSAFNALLKTLEEPPSQVIFIFATTEIQKIPVTILSRCQRFDLKRLSTEALTEHLKNIAEKEEITAEEEGLRLIAMAAEGSVRDGLSLLDRAIAHGAEGAETAPVTTGAIRGMLGLSDRTRVFALLEALFGGEVEQALQQLAAQYEDGADMELLLADMLQLVHTITRLHLTPGADLGPTYAEPERDYAKRLAEKLSVPSLTMAWQMLTKGREEVRRAPDTLMATEMLCVRLAHMAALPTPEQVITKLKEERQAGSVPTPPGPPGGGGGQSAGSGAAMTAAAMSLPLETPQPASSARVEDVPTHAHLSLAASNPAVALASFEDVLALAEEKREAMLHYHLVSSARLVAFEPGKITFQQETLSQADATTLAAFLKRATDRDWKITSVPEEGQPTIAAQQKAKKDRIAAYAAAHPDVQAVFESFPGAMLVEVEETKA